MRKLITAVLVTALVAGSGLANNLKISNIEVKGRDNQTALVKFDISWENSWRFAGDEDPLFFHDAAWVFFKMLPDGRTDWEHVRLEGKGINPTDFDTGSGTAIELVVPDDGVGMFVRRSQDGSGTTSVQRVTAVWNFATNGLTKSDKVKMQVFGLEVCYVAEGAFWVGDGLKDMGQFFEGGTGDSPKPFAITSAGEIECGNEEGKLWGASTSGNTSMGGAGSIPAAFPNGYNAFYCMKYAITQGQYADFLNTLTRQQQKERCSATTVGNYMSEANAGIKNRNTVRLMEDVDPQPRVYATVTPDRACNFISWADLAAFTAWAGLRPMTELEFEKACRGPMEPVAGEFAWGTTWIKEQTGHTAAADGSGMEAAAPGDANCCFNNKMGGPVRVGIYAVPGASREQAGASYWGIMELSGNLWERPVSVGNATGRSFTGLHGDGTLLAGGEAGVTFWPNAAATGTGVRGGNWYYAASYARASDRNSGASGYATRGYNGGGRAARSAPSGVVGP